MTQYIGAVPEAAKQEVIAVTSVRATDVEDWHEVGAAGEPAFENSWANQGGTAPTLAFYKDPFGRVWLKGHISTGTSGTTVFTLPVGYRTDAAYWFVFGSDYAVVDTTGTVSVTRASANSLLGSAINFRV